MRVDLAVNPGRPAKPFARRNEPRRKTPPLWNPAFVQFPAPLSERLVLTGGLGGKTGRAERHARTEGPANRRRRFEAVAVVVKRDPRVNRDREPDFPERPRPQKRQPRIDGAGAELDVLGIGTSISGAKPGDAWPRAWRGLWVALRGRDWQSEAHGTLRGGLSMFFGPGRSFGRAGPIGAQGGQSWRRWRLLPARSCREGLCLGGLVLAFALPRATLEYAPLVDEVAAGIGDLGQYAGQEVGCIDGLCGSSSWPPHMSALGTGPTSGSRFNSDIARNDNGRPAPEPLNSSAARNRLITEKRWPCIRRNPT